MILAPLFSCPFTENPETNVDIPDPITTPGGPLNRTPSDGKNDARTEQLWAQITRQNAETACMQEARGFAVESGYPESVIFSCACKAEETKAVKQYACTIQALDGGHEASIRCIKEEKTCHITSEQGSVSYTFEQLEALAR